MIAFLYAQYVTASNIFKYHTHCLFQKQKRAIYSPSQIYVNFDQRTKLNILLTFFSIMTNVGTGVRASTSNDIKDVYTFHSTA